MTLLLISTSSRRTLSDQPSGHLIVFDESTLNIVETCEIIEPPFRDKDPNPRGGLRGLRGISISEDNIAIANASTIFVYDKSWYPRSYFWHPTCAGIHDIELQQDNLWITSSRNDLIFCTDLVGNIQKHYDMRYCDLFADYKILPFLSREDILNGSQDFRDPSLYDFRISDSAHVNSLVILNDGDLIISCGLFRRVPNIWFYQFNDWLKRSVFSRLYSLCYRYYEQGKQVNEKNAKRDFQPQMSKTESVVIRIKPDGSSVTSIVVDGVTVPSHSLRILNDGSAIYLNSTSGEMIRFNPLTDEIVSITKVGTTFLRGARQLPDNSLMLGDGNKVIHFDPVGNQIISRTEIAPDLNEAVFDICVLPQGFDLPPLSFPQHHDKYLPVDQIHLRRSIT